MTYTALSEKGQLVVPKSVRDSLRLQPSDRFIVTIDDGKIILEPTLQTEDIFGMFKTQEKLDKEKIKGIIKSKRDKKFKKRL